MVQHQQLVILGLIFLFAVLFFLFIFLVWSESNIRKRRIVRKRLLYLSAGGNHGLERLNIYRKQALKDSKGLDRLLLSLPRIKSLDRLLLRSGIPLNAFGFILLTALMALGGAAGGYIFLSGHTAAALGAICAFLPYFSLRIREKAFLNQFTEQLPEAVDLLARALRSGHSLTSGFGMLEEEMEDPLKSEFAAVVDEIKLGLTLKEALDNLSQRIPDNDLRFFTVAVTLQKETGGNLTEILDKISRLIRERVQFKRHVKTMTAEGRLSAIILLALPVFMFAYVYMVNYDYISLLWTDKTGYFLLTGALVMMGLGAIMIKKITSIEV
ncbi:MAG: type II secretion system F family protein [Desulfurivibrionaceae bacterium]